MENELEFFDAVDSSDHFQNLNCNNSKDKFSNSGPSHSEQDKIKPALEPDEFFLNQMPTSETAPSCEEPKSSSHLFDEAECERSDEETEEKKEVEDPDDQLIFDDNFLIEMQAGLTDEQKQLNREEAKSLKIKGNLAFKNGEYNEALQLYTEALHKCLVSDKEERAVFFSNRAASKIQLKQFESAIEDCSKSIENNDTFLRAYLRRAETYEKVDKLDEALSDYQKVLELDSTVHQARSACLRLPDQIKIRNEKMKDEMIGKLKDLGNMVLRPFGLSTSNFKVQQDPSTGSYSINFQQNPQP